MIVFINRHVTLALALFLACASGGQYNESTPRQNCATDKENTSELCDLRLRIYSGDRWAGNSFMVLEKYTLHELPRTRYQMILRLSLNNDANFRTAVITVDGRQVTLQAKRVSRDDLYGFREVAYFDIGADFIRLLGEGKSITILMIGDLRKEYSVDDEDIPSILEFYRGL